ncbi:ribose 5-phosphate isomerase B [bacterium]|nr:ribose 5-phosphate isomerase B [candidate division CSSED10-310 bacterium]
MRIAVASDHAGWALKQVVLDHLRARGFTVDDLGPEDCARVDYPDYGEQVARAVAGGAADLGIALCGTGIGMSMTANKVPGIRAALCNEIYMAKMSRRHNDANVLCLGGRVIGPEVALEIVNVWLAEQFEGGRHAGRVAKINRLDG